MYLFYYYLFYIPYIGYLQLHSSLCYVRFVLTFNRSLVAFPASPLLLPLCVCVCVVCERVCFRVYK